METVTKIIRAKDKQKTFEIPKEFVDKDIRVTIETLNATRQHTVEENIRQLNELYDLARKKKIEIPKDMDIDKLMNVMNNALL